MRYLEIVELHDRLYIKSDEEIKYPATVVINGQKYEADVWRLDRDGKTHHHLMKETV